MNAPRSLKCSNFISFDPVIVFLRLSWLTGPSDLDSRPGAGWEILTVFINIRRRTESAEAADQPLKSAK